MEEEHLQKIVDVTLAYFADTTGEAAEIGMPYVKDENPVVLDYTGAIGISGEKRGGLYLTVPEAMAVEITTLTLAGAEVTDEDTEDMVGEMANVIAGHVTEVFSKDFQISVPLVIRGKPDNIRLPTAIPSYVIPINWRGFRAFLIVGIK